MTNITFCSKGFGQNKPEETVSALCLLFSVYPFRDIPLIFLKAILF